MCPASLTPTGRDPLGHRADTPASTNDLMARVVARDNLQRAWQRVKSNKGSPGSDRMTLDGFPAWARQHWPATRHALLTGRHQPQPVRRVSIPKPGGGKRLLGVPSIIDRVIQQAIAQILQPLFDPGFSESSFGFRPQRSAHGALRHVQQHIKNGNKIAVDIDLAKFFDTVNHDVLIDRVQRKVTDPVLLKLIRRYLTAGVIVGDYRLPTDIGTPQGGPLSPLLANILLDDLDQELERRGHAFARYADDLLILVRSPRAGERVMRSISRFLSGRLKLTVNTQKSQVGPVHKSSYLGYTFWGSRLRWTEQTLANFKYRVKRLTGRSWGVSMRYRLWKLRQYLQGWMGYYGLGAYRPIKGLESWIRRRLRMCYWKQWRHTRTRVRELRKLGTSKSAAIFTAMSGKAHWRLSKTLATQTGMTNEWLAKQGLISLRALWMKANGYA